MESLESLIQSAKTLFLEAKTPEALEDKKAQFLGKNGAITQHLKTLATLNAEEKKSAGQKLTRQKMKLKKRWKRAAPP